MKSIFLRSLVLLAMSLNRSCTQSGDNPVAEEGNGSVESSDVEFVYHKAEFEGKSMGFLRCSVSSIYYQLNQFVKKCFRESFW